MTITRCVVSAIALACLMLPAAAQEEQQQFLGEALRVLQMQREEAMNRLVNSEARNALLQRQIEAMRAKLQSESQQKSAAPPAADVEQKP